MHIEIDEGIRSVLIVEDEMIIAILMEDLIRDLGVGEVHLCADVAAAREVIETNAIDLVILDLQVRDGSTMPIADLLSEKAIPFVFSSGSDASALDPRHKDRPMLNKPFLDDDFKLIVLDTWTLSRSMPGQVPAPATSFGASD